MKHFRLQLALSCIPVAGFPIVLFWGMYNTYCVAHKRTHAFLYALLCLLPSFILGAAGAGGAYLVLRTISRSNIPLILTVCLLILIVAIWAIGWVCLAIQCRYISYISAREAGKSIL